MPNWMDEARREYEREIEEANQRYVQGLWSACVENDRGLHTRLLSLRALMELTRESGRGSSHRTSDIQHRANIARTIGEHQVSEGSFSAVYGALEEIWCPAGIVECVERGRRFNKYRIALGFHDAVDKVVDDTE